jgi:hypothetical protein
VGAHRRETEILESAIYNLLLNACQAATRSTDVPEVRKQGCMESSNTMMRICGSCRRVQHRGPLTSLRSTPRHRV